MYKIVFFGTPLFSAKILEKLLTLKFLSVTTVVTQEDRPTGRGKQLTPPPVKVVAEQNNLPVIQPRSIKKELSDFNEKLSAFGSFDLGIVVAFGQIIPESVLNIPKLGCINIHTSILPRWRGAAPIQRAIMAGDSETGVALMQMDSGLDTGGVIAEKRVKIENKTTYDELQDILLAKSLELLENDLEKILKDELEALPQSTNGITYASKISNAECEINFNKPATEVHNHIRGLSSIPGAFTYLNGKRLKVFRSHVVDNQSLAKLAGEITFSDNKTFRVQCNPGEIEIMEVQMEGKKRIGVEEFLRGVTLGSGEKLGRLA